MKEYKELVEVLYTAGRKIRIAALHQVLTFTETELIKTHFAEGDEEFLIDMKPSEILRNELDKYGKGCGIGIEIVGEALDNEIVGSGKPKYIVHVDVIDGTRETIHKVGLSYFEAGVLPWSENPRLSDTRFGIAVAIGFDPITGKLYSYFSDPEGSYRRDEEGRKEILKPTDEKEFNNRGYFNTITSFRGTGVLPVLKDRMFEELYGKPENPDVFHREMLTSCGELINIAKGSTRGVMDLRPAVSLIADLLGLEGYKSPAGLCMHPYDVSGAWRIIRDTNKAVIRFYDSNLKEVKPEEIPIRDVEMDLGYIACGNEILFDKVRTSLRKVLGNNYF